MKIAFITLSSAYNYGAVLQTYALWRYLNDSGNEAILIDYISERYNLDSPEYIYLFSGKWRKYWLTRFVWKKTYYKILKRTAKQFRIFLQENVPMTRTYFSNDELKKDPVSADLFIAGSDQIWNLDFSLDKKADKPFFLDFVPENKPKISYASSFGKIVFQEEQKKEIKELLKRFNAISVREVMGQDLLHQMCLGAKTVVDPTLLLKEAVWLKMTEKRMINAPYLIVFQIYPEQELLKVIKNIAEEKQLSLVIVSSNPIQKKQLYKWRVVYLPKVEEWLSYIRYSEFVITDSFHATVFSTIFEKEFLVDGSVKYNSRIQSYLAQIGLTDRVIENRDCDTIKEKMENEIEYKNVKMKMEQFIMDSKNWLNEKICKFSTWNNIS